MKRNYLLFIGIFIFMAFQVNAQYCVPNIANACDPEEINNVTFAGIDNDTGCETVVTDYTHLVAEVAIGETHELSVTITSDPGLPDGYLFAFIDWNQNESWDIATERYLLVGPTGTSGTYTINIEVPNDAEEGQTRMRIVNVFNHASGPFDNYDGCLDIAWGAGADYSVNVSTLSIADNNIDGFNYFYSTQNKNLTISANDALANISMFNILGQQVASKNLSSNNETISLGSLKDGIYLAYVKTANGNVSTFKMVKR